MDPAPAPTPTRAELYRARRWRIVRRWMVRIVLLAVIGTALGLVGWYGYKHWKLIKARRDVARAEESMKAEDYVTAMNAMREAYQGAPKDPEVLRGMARLLLKAGQADKTLWFWKQLSHQEPLKAADKVEMAQACLALGRADEAGAIIHGLAPEDLGTRPALEVQAALLKLGGDLAEADKTLRRALSVDPDDPESILRLAAMDVTSPFLEIRSRAADQLWKLARGTSRHATRAAAILAESHGLNAPQARELHKLMEGKSGASERDRCRVLLAVVELNPEMRAPVLAAEAAKRNGQSPPEMVEYFQWLFALGEHDAILERLKSASVLDVPQLAPLYMESLAAKERWDDIREELSRSAVSMLPSYEHALLEARCLRGLKESDDQVKARLEEAGRRALTTHQMAPVQRVAAFATRMGHGEVAALMYQEATKMDALRGPALAQLYVLQEEDRNPEDLLETLTQLGKAGLLTHAQTAQELYLKSLLGVELESVPARVDALAKEDGISSNTARFLHALLSFRMGDLASLKQGIDGIDPAALPVGQRAVYAGLLEACGEASRAFVIGEPIQRLLLMPQERQMLEKAL